MNKAYFTLLLLVSFVASSQTLDPVRYQESIFTSITTIPNVNYGSAPQWVWPYWEVDLNCDIYLPDGDDNTNRPLIIFAHAGGFINGSKDVDNMVAICDSFARMGFVTASLDYRKGFNPLDGESAERAVYRGIQDGKAAVRFFKENASAYDIDTNAIFFGGMSAGGFMALYVGSMDKESERPASTYGGGTVNDLECLDCAGNSFAHSSKVRGILDYWGAIDDTLIIEPGDAPILIMHGENDPTVPYDYGHPFGLGTLPETYGGLPVKIRSENVGRMVKFFTSTGDLHMLDGSNNGNFDDPPNSFWSDTLLPETMIFLKDILQPIPEKLSPDSQVVCFNEVLTFEVTDSAFSTYVWDYDELMISTISNDSSNQLTLQFNNSGDFNISVIEYDQLLYPSDTLMFNVLVMPEVEASYDFSQVVNDVSFTNSSSAGTYFEWSFGDGETSTEVNPSHTYLTDGIYEVMLIATDSAGCTDTTTQSITVFGLGTNEELNEFVIFPNPFEDKLIFETSIEVDQLEIFNSIGELIYVSHDLNSKIIDTHLWSGGVYLVRISAKNGEVMNFKLMKAL